MWSFVAPPSGRAGLAASPSDIARLVDRRTIAVTITHVDPNSGVRQDLRPIADIAHAHGAMLIVDVAQSAGVIPVDPVADGIDVAVGTAMKWLLGPPGDRIPIRDAVPARALRCATGRLHGGGPSHRRSTSAPSQLGRSSSRARSAECDGYARRPRGARPHPRDGRRRDCNPRGDAGLAMYCRAWGSRSASHHSGGTWTSGGPRCRPRPRSSSTPGFSAQSRR